MKRIDINNIENVTQQKQNNKQQIDTANDQDIDTISISNCAKLIQEIELQKVREKEIFVQKLQNNPKMQELSKDKLHKLQQLGLEKIDTKYAKQINDMQQHNQDIDNNTSEELYQKIKNKNNGITAEQLKTFAQKGEVIKTGVELDTIASLAARNMFDKAITIFESFKAQEVNTHNKGNIDVMRNDLIELLQTEVEDGFFTFELAADSPITLNLTNAGFIKDFIDVSDGIMSVTYGGLTKYIALDCTCSMLKLQPQTLDDRELLLAAIDTATHYITSLPQNTVSEILLQLKEKSIEFLTTLGYLEIAKKKKLEMFCDVFSIENPELVTAITAPQYGIPDRIGKSASVTGFFSLAAINGLLGEEYILNEIAPRMLACADSSDTRVEVAAKSWINFELKYDTTVRNFIIDNTKK